MIYPYFSHNGELQSIEQAVVPLDRVEYSYGFGVYETIRVTGGVPYFLSEHSERLITSAKIISLEHNFAKDFVKVAVLKLIEKNKVVACNIKILLIGGSSREGATLDILCLNPLFPDRKLYRDGAKVVSFKYEREYPAAKTLNMLSSYLAYRKAKENDAYDALLVNRRGFVTEGTRTNLLALNGKTIISPPVTQILPGITRAKVLEVASTIGFKVIELDIGLGELDQFENVFLTSTSSKIMSVSAIDGKSLSPPAQALQELIRAFDQFLDGYTVKT